MYNYELWQWFLFFYIYCFLGWVWETSYVSAKEKKFQNRGFMNGPFLPIYGSGAICILFAALPVRNNPVLVYIFGMLAATMLELVTGIAMEKTFHVRYWDYSYRKIQYKGHICLVSSIAWGAFSCILIYIIHKPIENLVCIIPETGAQIMTMTLTIICVSDFSTSFKTAIDFKRVLVKAEELRAQAALLEKRAEVLEAFLADSAGKKAEEAKERMAELVGKVSATREDVVEELSRIKGESAARLDSISETVSNYLAQNKAAFNLLKRNPGAVSEKYADTLRSFKNSVINTLKNKINRLQNQ